MADPGRGSGAEITVRVSDERDVGALARLRGDWLTERSGPVDDPAFEAAFGQWWRTEQPRRTFWLAEVPTPGGGRTAIGSINVVEIVHMPRPGARSGRIGHVGNAFVLRAFAGRGVPALLLDHVLRHAHDRGYSRLLLAPTAGSRAFYLRAGFVPAGEDWLALDPATDPPGTAS